MKMKTTEIKTTEVYTLQPKNRRFDAAEKELHANRNNGLKRRSAENKPEYSEYGVKFEYV